MSRKLSHTPPMPTFADMQLAEKLRRELGSASGQETQPENVAQVARPEAAAPPENPNAQYAAPQPLPKAAEVKTIPNSNVILEITMPPEVTAALASADKGETAPKRPVAATVPGLQRRRAVEKKKTRTRAAIIGILGGAGLAVCVIFVAFARPSATAADKPAATMVATTTMASVVPAVTVIDIPPPEPVVTPAVTAVTAEPAATTAAVPARSAKPSRASSATPPAPVPFQKDDIDRQIR